MKDQEILQKVKKLLALGQSDNENEAKNAMRLAQRLMLEHSIRTSDIEKSEFESTGVMTCGRAPYWIKRLFDIIGFNFSCVVGIVVNTSEKKKNYTYTFIGRNDSAQVARDAFCAYRMAMVRWSCQHQAGVKRKSFMYGCLDGLASTLFENVSTVPNGSIVLKKDFESVLKHLEKENYVKIKNTAEKKVIVDRESYSKGVEMGKTLNQKKEISQ